MKVRITKYLKFKMAVVNKNSKMVAQEIGITPTHLARITNGKTTSITFDQIGKLCSALNVEPGDLFEAVEE